MKNMQNINNTQYFRVEKEPAPIKPIILSNINPPCFAEQNATAIAGAMPNTLGRIFLLVLRIYHSNSILVYLGGNVNILCRDENVES